MKKLILLITIFVTLFSKIIFSQVPALDWVHTYGNSGVDQGTAVAVDASGNVYATGYFFSTVDFDPGVGVDNRTSKGGRDIYIQKTDGLGNVIWTITEGGTGDDIGLSIATDAAGNVYITGYYSRQVDFDPGVTLDLHSSAFNSIDIYIQKLDASGNLLWAKTMGSNGNDVGTGIAVDGSGNVFVTGYFKNTVDFDSGIGVDNHTSAGGTNDIFIQKLDALGNFIWARTMGGTGFLNLDRGNGITTDVIGNVYVTGNFSGTVDFDSGIGVDNHTAIGFFSSGQFVQKLDAFGNVLWTRTSGGGGSAGGASIITDGASNIYVTGTFSGTVDFDPGIGVDNHSSVSGSRDIYIQKLDALGNFIWARTIGGSSEDRGQSITTDATGNVYSTGYFQGTIDFDPGVGVDNQTSLGVKDFYIQKLDASGNFIWASPIGGTGQDEGASIAVDGSAIFLTGYFQRTVDFDPSAGVNNQTSFGGIQNDAFILKLSNPFPLPITLLSFDAINEDKNVKTSWSTASEINNDYFTVLRSKDAVNFEPIGIVGGAGNSNQQLAYQFYDDSPFQGISYYQLKQTDFDGTYSYSDIVSVNRNNLGKIAIYPNPVNNTLFIQFNNNQFSFLEIINSLGQIVYSNKELQNEQNLIQINIQSLVKGIYFVKLINLNGEVHQKKIIKR